MESSTEALAVSNHTTILSPAMRIKSASILFLENLSKKKITIPLKNATDLVITENGYVSEIYGNPKSGKTQIC